MLERILNLFTFATCFAADNAIFVHDPTAFRCNRKKIMLVSCFALQSASAAAFRMPDGGGDGRKSQSTDFWWDIAGWVTLIGLGMGVMALSKNGPAAVSPPPMPMK